MRTLTTKKGTKFQIISFDKKTTYAKDLFDGCAITIIEPCGNERDLTKLGIRNYIKYA